MMYAIRRPFFLSFWGGRAVLYWTNGLFRNHVGYCRLRSADFAHFRLVLSSFGRLLGVGGVLKIPLGFSGWKV